MIERYNYYYTLLKDDFTVEQASMLATLFTNLEDDKEMKKFKKKLSDILAYILKRL